MTTSVLVTGSADGIGRETARTLIRMGHRVVVHARSVARAAEVREAIPGAAEVVVGDLASLEETRTLAAVARRHGPYDAVIHNAGVGGGAPHREVTDDGIERIFQVNVLAPYLLTALMERPARLVYLTSGLEAHGVADLDDLQNLRGRWDGEQAYSDSKLCDVLLAFAVARRWPEVLSNAVDPGWIRTRMGGPGAPGTLDQGAETPVWLATGDDPAAVVSGRYFKRRRELRANPFAYDEALQEGLLERCAAFTGVTLAG
jgi:NAD(P)-dependent dehydrogenase (short-subunit alcohol dehydrogenase family)